MSVSQAEMAVENLNKESADSGLWFRMVNSQPNRAGRSARSFLFLTAFSSGHFANKEEITRCGKKYFLFSLNLNFLCLIA